LALSDVAAAQPTQLDFDAGQAYLGETPNAALRVSQHHRAFDAADRFGEGVEILETLRFHEDAFAAELLPKLPRQV
jgi:hypothetical protein